MYTLIVPVPYDGDKLPQMVVYHAHHAFAITQSGWVVVHKSRGGYSDAYYVNRYVQKYNLSGITKRVRIVIPAECSTNQVTQTIQFNLGCVERIDFYAEYNERLYLIPVSPIDTEFCCINMMHPNPGGYRDAVLKFVKEIDCLRFGIQRKAYIDEILETL